MNDPLRDSRGNLLKIRTNDERARIAKRKGLSIRELVESRFKEISRG